MNPDDITLVNTSQQFEYEKISREIDQCNDVESLRQMCKFVIKLEMKTRANYSVNAIIGKPGPMASVKGVIISGFVLSLALVLVIALLV